MWSVPEARAGCSQLRPDTVGVSSHSEPPLVIAAATTATLPKEGSAPQGRIASLLDQAGAGEVGDRAVFADSNNVGEERRAEVWSSILLYHLHLRRHRC